jgi:prolyl oligopeptidase family protein
MKMGPRVVIAVFAVLVIAACKNHDNGSQMPAPAPQRGALLQSPVQETASYSPTALLAVLGGSTFEQILLQLVYVPICTINVYHLEYETVDPAGNLTPASGALMVPSGAASCQGGRAIVVYAHGTATNRNYNIADLAASGNDEGLLMAAVFVAQGYIVVAPNYVGYDTSTLGYHPYLTADQQSKDLIDALTAARSALPTAGAPSTTDSGKLFVTGYSQGGFVAMATHRAMQAAGIAVTAAAPMSGPYALSAFGDAVFEGQVNMSATVNFTLLVSGYQHTYGNIYASTTDVFSPTYATGIDSLLPSTTAISVLETEGKIPSSELFSSTPPAPSYAAYTPATTPAGLATVFAAGFGAKALIANSYRASYLQDAFANPDGGFPSATNGLPPANPANSLRQAFKTNDLRTWAPTVPVLLCGGDSDPTVFYFNTQLIQTYWAATAPTAPVTVLDIDSAVAPNDPYGTLKTAFTAAKAAVIASALAGGATDGGLSAVLNAYHARLVPPFCLSAAKSFFDGH